VVPRLSPAAPFVERRRYLIVLPRPLLAAPCRYLIVVAQADARGAAQVLSRGAQAAARGAARCAPQVLIAVPGRCPRRRSSFAAGT
jgi:hypothetical protein